MARELLYLDSSALAKLVLPEAETGALLGALGGWPERVSSELAVVEVSRAVRKATASPVAAARLQSVLAGIHLLRVDREVIERAATLEPASLRSLDALHLASALTLGEDLGGFAVYDNRLAAAAVAAGLRVLSPA